MTDLDTLYRPEPPWVVVHSVNRERGDPVLQYLYGKDGVNSIIRRVRGRKMQTFRGLFNEFGAALQFFEGFGDNANALWECLLEIDEWISGESYVLIVTRPLLLLCEEADDSVTWFLKLFREVGEWWRRPIDDNGQFNRPAIPFHVVLQCDHGEVIQVMERFGAPPFLELAPTPSSGGE